MQNDDLMPNDGTYFGGVPLEPPEQAIARKKERAQAIEKDNILKDLLERWEEKIKFYNSTASFSDEVKLNPELLSKLVIAYAEVTSVLEAEKEYIQSLIR